jgi:hypothetical protein
MKTIPSLFFLLLSAGVVLYSSCRDIDHSNRLDPKNPDAEADQITVVENFVHRYTTGDSVNRYIAYSQQALYDLKQEYGDKMLILEYHMKLTDTTKKDTLAIPDNQLRYNEYQGGAPRAFPHAFFNGKQISIQGSSSVESVKERYKKILSDSVNKKTKLYCDAQMSITGNTLKINSKIARYGDKDISNLLVEYIVIENIGQLAFYTVRYILLPEVITTIKPGEVYALPEKTLELNPAYSKQNLDVIIVIKDNISKKILQSCKVY